MAKLATILIAAYVIFVGIPRVFFWAVEHLEVDQVTEPEINNAQSVPRGPRIISWHRSRSIARLTEARIERAQRKVRDDPHARAGRAGKLLNSFEVDTATRIAVRENEIDAGNPRWYVEAVP